MSSESERVVGNSVGGNMLIAVLLERVTHHFHACFDRTGILGFNACLSISALIRDIYLSCMCHLLSLNTWFWDQKGVWNWTIHAFSIPSNSPSNGKWENWMELWEACTHLSFPRAWTIRTYEAVLKWVGVLAHLGQLCLLRLPAALLGFRLRCFTSPSIWET